MESGVVDQGRRGAAWGYQLQEAERKLGERGQRKGGDRGKHGLRM